MAEQEKKALPDWFIIKREILWSFFECAKLLAIIYRSKRMNKRNDKALLSFEGEVVKLYYKSQNLIKSDKKFKKLKGIEKYVVKGNKIGLEKSLEYYNIITEMLDKRNILDILKEVEDVSF